MKIEDIKDKLAFPIAVLLCALFIGWVVFQAYLDIKMKWNLAHINNCPCLTEVQK